jgi:hypothetical protein
MKTPATAPRSILLVGMLGFCFGALGLIAGVQDIALQYVLSAQRQAAKACESQAANTDCGWNEPALPGVEPGWSREIGNYLSRPPWHPRYAQAMAATRLLLGLGLMAASAKLLLVRRRADYWFIGAGALSAVRNLVAAVVGIAAGSLLSFWTVAVAVVGLSVDAALVVLCLASNRSVYRPP